MSMTGFGSAEGAVGAGRARVEIRTVNHRWFNLAARIPADWGALEAPLRDALRHEFSRGQVHVQVQWIDDTEAPVGFDAAKAEALVAALRALQQRLGLGGGGKGGGELTIGQIAPLLVQMGAPVQVASRCPEWGELAPIVAQAAAACRAARQREGEALRRDLVARFVALRVATERIARVAPDRVARERDRLAANVARLTGLAEVDAGRLAQEVAIAADRLDVHEELVRLAAHLQAAEQALGGEQPAGKALGFLAQEIGRELNTIGAKASDAVIGREVVAMKGELEKVREQVENLE